MKKLRDDVRKRDGGRCTYLSEGQRCPENNRLMVWPLTDIPKGGERHPALYGLFCAPHAALWELGLPRLAG